MDAEAFAQALFERKAGDARECLAGLFDGFDAGGNKCANVLAELVEGEEIPFTVDVCQVIRVDAALFGLFLAGLAISKFDLPLGRGGFGQGVKDFQIENLLGTCAKGNRLMHIREA